MGAEDSGTCERYGSIPFAAGVSGAVADRLRRPSDRRYPDHDDRLAHGRRREQRIYRTPDGGGSDGGAVDLEAVRGSAGDDRAEDAEAADGGVLELLVRGSGGVE